MLPKLSSNSTHVDLLQFAHAYSRESSLWPQRPLQIAETPKSSESHAESRPERASTPRAHTPPLLDAASSSKPVISVKENEPVPQSSSRDSTVAEEDDCNSAERSAA